METRQPCDDGSQDAGGVQLAQGGSPTRGGRVSRVKVAGSEVYKAKIVACQLQVLVLQSAPRADPGVIKTQ